MEMWNSISEGGQQAVQVVSRPLSRSPAVAQGRAQDRPIPARHLDIVPAQAREGKAPAQGRGTHGRILPKAETLDRPVLPVLPGPGVGSTDRHPAGFDLD